MKVANICVAVIVAGLAIIFGFAGEWAQSGLLGMIAGIHMQLADMYK